MPSFFHRCSVQLLLLLLLPSLLITARHTRQETYGPGHLSLLHLPPGLPINLHFVLLKTRHCPFLRFSTPWPPLLCHFSHQRPAPQLPLPSFIHQLDSPLIPQRQLIHTWKEDTTSGSSEALSPCPLCWPDPSEPFFEIVR